MHKKGVWMRRIKSYSDVWYIEQSEDKKEVKVVAVSQPKEKGAFMWLELAKIVNGMIDDGYELLRSDEEFIGEFGTYSDHLCVVPSVDTGRVDVVTTEPRDDGETDNYRVEMKLRKEQ
jgi:hypothetical protein